MQLAGKDGKLAEVSIKDLGIGYPAIVSDIVVKPTEEVVIDPNAEDPNPDPKTKGSTPEHAKVKLPRFDFTLQFSWQPTPLGKRVQIEAERAKQLKEQQQQQPNQPPADGQAVNP